jgi:hypothetical protein
MFINEILLNMHKKLPSLYLAGNMIFRFRILLNSVLINI